MEQEMLVLGYKGYDFEQNGKEVSGAKVYMVGLDSANDQLTKGHVPVTQNFDLKYVKQLETFPAIYNVKFQMMPGKNGKPSLEITSMTYVRDFEVV